MQDLLRSALGDYGQLAKMKRDTYARMLDEMGLTMEEAATAIDEHERQVSVAMSKFQKASQQAGMALAARLAELRAAKERT